MSYRIIPFLLLNILLLACYTNTASPTDSLAVFFKHPPNSAKPRAWWFWGETIITENGITKDLEALKRVGFGGVVIYEQVFTDRPDAYKSLSPEWMEKVRYAAKECARLNMSLEVNMSSGYVAGGPWITPELGMQRLVFSELTVQGSKHFSATLPKPPTKLGYYKDVAVLAYPTTEGTAVERLQPVRSSQPADIDLATLFDVASGKRLSIAPPANHQPVLIQSDYGQPVTLRSVSYAVRSPLKALVIATQVPTHWSDTSYGQGMRAIPNIGKLESSNDGVYWDSVCALPSLGYLHDSWYRQTLSFPAVAARYYRFYLKDWGTDANEKLSLGGIELHGETLIDQWEKKTGNVVDFDNGDKTPAYTTGEVIGKRCETERGADGQPGTWCPKLDSRFQGAVPQAAGLRYASVPVCYGWQSGRQQGVVNPLFV